MNDQQINEAIARHCGWVECVPGRFAMQGMTISVPLEMLPDYCDDLNAMHGAKLTMSRSECENFNAALIDLRSPPSWAPDSPHQSLRRSWGQPARIEAKAFLRAVGKWEDGQ